MKLTITLLVAFILQASAASYAQKITLSVYHTPLATVFEEIRTQCGYDFLVTTSMLKNAKPVTVNVKAMQLPDVLIAIFADQPLNYRIQDNSVVVSEKQASVFDAIQGTITRLVASHVIRGTVSDERGPLVGVSIHVKGTEKAATTDSDGIFYVNSVNDGDILVFSYIGYKTLEVVVKNQTPIKVTLEAEVAKLQDVVVVAYGTTQRKDLTGAVSTVSAKDLENVPFNTVDNALAGKAAGVQVTKSDGTPGGAVRIRIRGSSSLLGGNDPLYVIDGVPLQTQSNYVNPGYSLSSPIGVAASGGNSVVSNVGISGLSSAFVNGLNSLGGLNPDDIESITILKDASSTAIYGSKAANGVVIITTKHGKKDMVPEITASYYTTVSSTYNRPHLLDTRQYKSLLTEAAQNQQSFDNISGYPLSTNANLILNDPTSFFGNANTNWINEVTRTSVSHNAEVSVQGGSNSSKYFSSISYNNTPGVVKATNFQRISGKINLENDISTQFRFVTNLILGYTNQNIGDNAYAQALGARPDLSPYDASGNYLNFDQAGEQNSPFANPLALLTATNNAKTVTLLGSLSAIYNITKNLQFKSSGSLNYMGYNQRNYTPSYLDLGSAYGNVANAGGIGSNSNRRLTNWFWENTLTYDKKFNNKNSLNVLVGQSYETTKASFFSATGAGYPNDNVLTGLSSAVSPLYVSGDDPSLPQSYLLSYYARATYDLMDKYLFTFTGRTDGSSKFGPNNKFGYFPSGAFAWRISQEGFLKNVKWLDDFKLRVSYGLTGNQNIGDQMYRTLFSPYSYAGTSALIPTQLGNNGIKWESTKEADGGLDISLFNNRLTATIDYYNKQTNGDLLSLPVAPSSSYTSLLSNAVAIKNTGFEITVSGDFIKDNSFKWSGSVNVTFNKSIVTHLDLNADLNQIGSASGLETLTSFYGGNTTLIQGKPLGIITGQYVTGIIKTQAQADAYKNQLGGNAAYYPTSIGDPIFRLDPSTAADGYENAANNQTIGYGAPKFYGGIMQDFTYKKFNLEFYFTYSVGGHLLWGDHAASTEFQGVANANATILNRYYPGNTNTDEPRLLLDYYNYTTSNLDVFSSSYLKLRTLILHYDLTVSNWLKRAGMKNTSLFISATNVFTITKYPGNDPEISDDPYSVTGGYFDVSNYPTIRTFSIGLKARF